jgi:hypothetical protein
MAMTRCVVKLSVHNVTNIVCGLNRKAYVYEKQRHMIKNDQLIRLYKLQDVIIVSEDKNSVVTKSNKHYNVGLNVT